MLNVSSLTGLHCYRQDICLGDYPAVDDDWVDVISSQGSSLLSVDLSGSDVTDSGLGLLKSCSNLQALTFNYCENISDNGLRHISGKSSWVVSDNRNLAGCVFCFRSKGMEALLTRVIS